MDVSFVARPTGATAASTRDTIFQQSVFFRTADPTDPAKGPKCQEIAPPGEAGFTLVTVLGAMVVSALLTVSAFAAVNGDTQRVRQRRRRASRRSPRPRPASTSTSSGSTATTTTGRSAPGSPTPNAVNDPWNGTRPDPRTWQSVPGAATQYTIELLPANGYSKCQPGPNVSDTVIDAAAARCASA